MLRRKLKAAAEPQNANESLWQAINDADLNAVKDALKAGACVNAAISSESQIELYGRKGSTALVLAAGVKGQEAAEIFSLILGQNNVDLYAADETGAEAGTIALSNGHDERLVQYVAAVKLSLLESQKAKRKDFTGPNYTAL